MQKSQLSKELFQKAQFDSNFFEAEDSDEEMKDESKKVSEEPKSSYIDKAKVGAKQAYRTRSRTNKPADL